MLCAVIAMLNFHESSQPQIHTTRKSSGVGFSTRTRTGYLAARCTQLSVRCTSGRPLSSFPDDIRIGSDSKTYAVHYAENRHIGLGQDVNFGTHSRLDVCQLPLAKVADCPHVRASIQREDVLPTTWRKPLRNRQVCDQSVKRRIHVTFVEVVASVLHG